MNSLSRGYQRSLATRSGTRRRSEMTSKLYNCGKAQIALTKSTPMDWGLQRGWQRKRNGNRAGRAQAELPWGTVACLNRLWDMPTWAPLLSSHVQKANAANQNASNNLRLTRNHWAGSIGFSVIRKARPRHNASHWRVLDCCLWLDLDARRHFDGLHVSRGWIWRLLGMWSNIR